MWTNCNALRPLRFDDQNWPPRLGDLIPFDLDRCGVICLYRQTIEALKTEIRRKTTTYISKFHQKSVRMSQQNCGGHFQWVI